MKAVRLFMVWCALMLAASAFAQMKCKMPNGVVVTRSMGSCPIDALEAYTLDGQPLPKPSESPEAQRAKAEMEERRKQQDATEQARIKAAIDERVKQMKEEAQRKKALEAKRLEAKNLAIQERACSVLLLERFQCKEEVSLWSGNFVEISTHILRLDLHATCRGYAMSIRNALLDGTSSKGNWSVRIKYSPTGATVSECPI